MALVVHFDGGARGNPGPAGAGVVIATEAGDCLHEGGYFLGPMTNNAAEYNALILALRRAAEMPPDQLRLHSDSELLVRQITGEYRVKNPVLQQLHEQAQLLLLKVKSWTIHHVRREHNRRADELANLAMDRETDVIVTEHDPDITRRTTRMSKGNGHAAHAAGAPTAGGEADGARTDVPAVRIAVTRPPAEDGCPAGQAFDGDALLVGARLPSGMCTNCAQAVLPTVLAIQRTAPGEVGLVPAMVIVCAQGGCGAQFSVAPAPGANGGTSA